MSAGGAGRAIGVGFAGVLLVIQPRPGDVDVWTWLALFASLVGALRDVIAPLGAGRRADAGGVASARRSRVAVVGCVWALIEGWQPMARGVWLVLGSSLLLARGYQFLMIALRSGAEISVIGSFRYASVLWAIAIGYVLWGDVPNCSRSPASW